MRNKMGWLVLAVCFAGNTWADTQAHDGRGFFVLGRLFSDPSALNAELAPREFGTFKNATLVGGQGLGLTPSGVLLGGEGYAVLFSSTADPGNPSNDVSFGGGMGFFDIGFPVVNDSDLRIYPLVGLGGGALHLSLRDLTPSSFTALLNNPKRDASATKSFAAINLSLNLDYLFDMNPSEKEHGGIAVGLKVGYFFTFLRSGWKMHDVTFTSGPEASLDGPYLAFMIGGGGRKPHGEKQD